MANVASSQSTRRGGAPSPIPTRSTLFAWLCVVTIALGVVGLTLFAMR